MFDINLNSKDAFNLKMQDIIFNETATGGIVAGGNANDDYTINETGTGGLVAGGTATEVYTSNVNGIGGIVAGGIVLPLLADYISVAWHPLQRITSLLKVVLS